MAAMLIWNRLYPSDSLPVRLFVVHFPLKFDEIRIQLLADAHHLIVREIFLHIHYCYELMPKLLNFFE